MLIFHTLTYTFNKISINVPAGSPGKIGEIAKFIWTCKRQRKDKIISNTGSKI